jgi:hypothetical protein
MGKRMGRDVLRREAEEVDARGTLNEHRILLSPAAVVGPV